MAHCVGCDYVYDPSVGDVENGILVGTVFQDLPAEWCCPICGLPKDSFEVE